MRLDLRNEESNIYSDLMLKFKEKNPIYLVKTITQQCGKNHGPLGKLGQVSLSPIEFPIGSTWCPHWESSNPIWIIISPNQDNNISKSG